ncbi:MAG TPA: TIR domain-containing protein, partial [Herpetosiphonaceae bacterium]
MASRPLSVFLCHSSNDKPEVRNLYYRLQNEGVRPWLDEVDLLPGQYWEEEIQKAVQSADIFIVCISNSVNSTGFLQKEINYALDIAEKQPKGTIFIIPVRLERCEVPDRLRRFQWVDLYEERGYSRLIQALHIRAKSIGATTNAHKKSRRNPGTNVSQNKSSPKERDGRPRRMTVFAEIAAIIATIVAILGFLGYSRWNDMIGNTAAQEQTNQASPNLPNSLTPSPINTAQPLTTDTASAVLPETATIATEITLIITETTTPSPTPTIEPTPVTPTPTPVGPFGRLAFTSNRNGNKEIYIIDADGTNLRRVTDNQ